jgi:choline dehydrogenase-like flavoprotein
MIVSARGLAMTPVIETDLCIVGAGAAGIAIALQFAGSGHAVLLLESGGERPDAQGQSLCAGEVVDPALHPPAEAYRRRGLGGCTTLWGGRCVPLDDIDFAPRPWLGLPALWPMQYEDLVPYWHRAAALAELGPRNYREDYDAETAIAGGMRPMFAGFADAAVSTNRIERFSRPTNFAAQYGPALRASRRITTLLHATCREILLTPDGRAVRQLEVGLEGGGRLAVRARCIVLAAGGIEVPRLLLASTSHSAAGIGNAHDQVGRNYMCHLAGTLGTVAPAVGTKPYHGYDRTKDGVYCRRRFSIDSWAQQAAGIGNAIARLHHPRIANPDHGSASLSSLYLASGLLPAEYTRRLATPAPSRRAAHLRNIARDPAGAVAFGLAMMRHRFLAARKYPSVTVVPRHQLFTLDVHAEQLPNPDSRITLAQPRDRFGVHLPRIDWRYLPEDIRTVRGTLALIGGALEAGGHATLAWDPAGVEADMLRDGAYGGHHLGTARMSETPRTGVVDADCRVHGVENLFIAGGAVFPTSGQANPTLTILALALRLADHLKVHLAEQAATVAVGQKALEVPSLEVPALRVEALSL